MIATNWPAIDESCRGISYRRPTPSPASSTLKPLVQTSINTALGMDDAEAELQSPLIWQAPAGLRLDAVVGGDESAEYLRQSRTIAERWGRAGVDTRYEAVPGENHFTVIAPLADPGSAMTRASSTSPAPEAIARSARAMA